MSGRDNPMASIYFPFIEDDVLEHFAEIKSNKSGKKKYAKYYEKSIAKYQKFKENKSEYKTNIVSLKRARQIEKDERFWTAACLMTLYHSDEKKRTQELVKLFKKAYGETPPINNIASWEQCINGNLKLFFEAKLPSPKLYKNWLTENIKSRQFIPYVLECSQEKTNLEGRTTVDAIFVNSDNGFAVIIEAKVLSDISYFITYDTMRNQMARIIDVMLEKNDNLTEILKKRDPDKTLFLLITPKIFKENPESRLYGYKFNEYKNNIEAISKDLPHRKNISKNLSKRLGWLTWEDFNEVNNKCCQWLKNSE
jgi:hypothetical protein